METDYLGTSLNKWAEAIVLRVVDEWEGNNSNNHEDVILLRTVLEKSLKENPENCKKLIGTSIIEEDYFDELRF